MSGNARLNERLSISTHAIERWQQRIDNSLPADIKSKIAEIYYLGKRETIEKDKIKVHLNGIEIIVLEISPLHMLVKTVYKV